MINNLQEVVNKTAFIKLDVEVDNQKLLKEYTDVEERYGFQNYRTNYWPVRKKYGLVFLWSVLMVVFLVICMRDHSLLQSQQDLNQCVHIFIN